MLFIPYKFDLSLSRIPYLTILVCLLCTGIYAQQYRNEAEFERKSIYYCSHNLSTVEQMAMKKTFGDASPYACLDLMYELEMSDDPQSVIAGYAAGSEKFAGFSAEDSRLYIEGFLLQQYEGYKAAVPELKTKALWYVPDSWNPVTMVTSTFAHGSWDHLVGNLVFFYAFAAAVELIIGSLMFFAVIMTMVFGTNVAYSLAMLSSANPLPTVGLSGVVMGMIAMLTYFLPTAKIRCFYWIFIRVGTIAVSAFILATIYIGLDVYTLLTKDDLGGVNLIAHVSGAALGFLLGFAFFRTQKRSIVIE
jgi:membrane associated rhomboid family serine protease